MNTIIARSGLGVGRVRWGGPRLIHSRLNCDILGSTTCAREVSCISEACAIHQTIIINNRERERETVGIKVKALMLIFGRYAGIPVHRSPLASECNRDGSTRFFTLNTDPSRIKQELFLFISRYLASCQHIPLSSILRGCFWLLLIFPNNFENFLRNQYSRSKRRW